MALSLGIAVAAGGLALGKIAVERGDVLYMALEDNPRRLQTRLRILLGSASPPEGLQIDTEWPRLDEGGMDQLTGWLDEHPAARLVVIDVWSRVRPYSRDTANQYQSDYEAAATLQAVAIKYGIAIVCLFHTRKAEADDFVETVQGTLGTAGAADTIVVLKRARGEADATLFVTGRDVLEQELALRFAPDTGTWELLGDANEYAVAKTRRQVIEAIRAHGPLTPKKLSDLTGIDHELAKKTMLRMSYDGQLHADKGNYDLPSTPVPGVPLSLNDLASGDTGTRGTGVRR